MKESGSAFRNLAYTINSWAYTCTLCMQFVASCSHFARCTVSYKFFHSKSIELTIIFIIFETLWCFIKYSCHHKWHDAWLLLINMVYTSCLTSCRTLPHTKTRATLKCPRPINPPKDPNKKQSNATPLPWHLGNPRQRACRGQHKKIKHPWETDPSRTQSNI